MSDLHLVTEKPSSVMASVSLDEAVRQLLLPEQGCTAHVGNAAKIIDSMNKLLDENLLAIRSDLCRSIIRSVDSFRDLLVSLDQESVFTNRNDEIISAVSGQIRFNVVQNSARYLWIRDNNHLTQFLLDTQPEEHKDLKGKDLDVLVDDAMGGTKGADYIERNASRYVWLRERKYLDLFWSVEGSKNKSRNIDEDIDTARRPL